MNTAHFPVTPFHNHYRKLRNFQVADNPGLSRLQRRQDRVAPLFRLQNLSFSANWIERGPPIWDSGLIRHSPNFN